MSNQPRYNNSLENKALFTRLFGYIFEKFEKLEEELDICSLKVYW